LIIYLYTYKYAVS